MNNYSYSFLDANENIGIPQPMNHAGLYTSTNLMKILYGQKIIEVLE